MQAIRCATRAEADGFASRVDAALGIPRCERLTGGITQIGGGRHVDSCPCVQPDAPDPACKLATRAEAEVFALRSGEHAYPVVDPEARATLTAGERLRLEDVPESERA